MKALMVVVAALVLALSLLVLVNWEAVTASTSLSVGVTSVQAPLGVTLLALFGLIVATLLGALAYQRTAALVEARKFGRELRAQRELADQAEASRFTELRTYLDGELRKVHAQASAADLEANRRHERLEQVLLGKLSEIANGLFAQLGEMEDRFERTMERQDGGGREADEVDGGAPATRGADR